jgi:hypothetical protein
MEDQSERKINVGVGRETPEDVLVRQDSGDRSERGDAGCLAGLRIGVIGFD